MTAHDRPVVLAVDDERTYLESYERWLEEEYEVRTTTDPQSALSMLDESVDVVLLDRKMPGLSGGQVLERIRERDLDCRVAMVTAVEPEMDILEMGFDEYLVKPVSEGELRAVVRSLIVRSEYDALFQECFALASKKAALEASLDRATLEQSEEYQELKRRLEETEERANDALDDLLEEGDIVAAYRSIGE